MLGRRGKLPVLAEISGPAAVEGRAWSLRRPDFDQVCGLVDRLRSQRVVLVTGAGDAVGPAAIALAGVATASGLRVALLDADLGRPRLATDLGLAPTPGIHEYLRWEAEAPALLQPLALGGAAAAGAAEALVFVAAGRPAADPATLLALPSFEHMIGRLRDAYQLLVVAGPPLSAEPEELAPLVVRADLTLVAVTPAQTKGRPRRAVGAAIATLPRQPFGQVVVGCEQSAAEQGTAEQSAAAPGPY
jgi:Mrp family chromosome partitioning ATPase